MIKLEKKIPKIIELKTDKTLEEIRKQILQLKKDGLGVNKIAKIVGIGKTTVCHAIKKSGSFKD